MLSYAFDTNNTITLSATMFRTYRYTYNCRGRTVRGLPCKLHPVSDGYCRIHREQNPGKQEPPADPYMQLSWPAMSLQQPTMSAAANGYPALQQQQQMGQGNAAGDWGTSWSTGSVPPCLSAFSLEQPAASTTPPATWTPLTPPTLVGGSDFFAFDVAPAMHTVAVADSVLDCFSFTCDSGSKQVFEMDDMRSTDGYYTAISEDDAEGAEQPSSNDKGKGRAIADYSNNDDYGAREQEDDGFDAGFDAIWLNLEDEIKDEGEQNAATQDDGMSVGLDTQYYAICAELGLEAEPDVYDNFKLACLFAEKERREMLEQQRHEEEKGEKEGYEEEDEEEEDEEEVEDEEEEEEEEEEEDDDDDEEDEEDEEEQDEQNEQDEESTDNAPLPLTFPSSRNWSEFRFSSVSLSSSPDPSPAAAYPAAWSPSLFATGHKRSFSAAALDNDTGNDDYYEWSPKKVKIERHDSLASAMHEGAPF